MGQTVLQLESTNIMILGVRKLSGTNPKQCAFWMVVAIFLEFPGHV